MLLFVPGWRLLRIGNIGDTFVSATKSNAVFLWYGLKRMCSLSMSNIPIESFWPRNFFITEKYNAIWLGASAVISSVYLAIHLYLASTSIPGASPPYSKRLKALHCMSGHGFLGVQLTSCAFRPAMSIRMWSMPIIIWRA
jgi:hypothetical protein